MEFKDKINQSVAAEVAKIMGEALHPNQQKLDVHEPEKDKLTADDFKKLRSGKKPDMKKEEVEELDEVKMADLPSTKVQGRSYGASKPEPHVIDTIRHPKDKELKSIEAEKKKPVNEEDAYDKNVKPSDKPHDKDAVKKRAQTSAVAARKVMSMSAYSASKKSE
jgi:hypothetical protein